MIKRVKPKSRLVNVNNPAELRAWAKYWGCAQVEIREAVRYSGPPVEGVEDWIKINVVR